MFNVVGVYLCRLDVHIIAFGMYGIYYFVALFLSAAGNHKLAEVRFVLCDFKCGHGSNATCANHKNFSHIVLLFLFAVFVLPQGVAGAVRGEQRVGLLGVYLVALYAEGVHERVAQYLLTEVSTREGLHGEDGYALAVVV